MSALDDKILRFKADLDLTHLIVHGNEFAVVDTEGGPVPSMRKAQKDALGSYIIRAEKAANDAELAAGGIEDMAAQAQGYATVAVNARNEAVTASSQVLGAVDELTAVVDVVTTAKNDTIAARDAAQGFRDAAGGYSETAVNAAGAANQSKDAAAGSAQVATDKAAEVTTAAAAVTQAKTDTEGARDTAVAAANAAGQSETNASGSASAANQAKTDTETARDLTLGYRDESVTAKNAAQQAATDAANAVNALIHSVGVACSDETTNLVAKVAQTTFRMPYGMALQASNGLRASLTTAAAGTTLFTVDIKVNGVSILTTKLTFNSGSKTTVGATTAAVVSNNIIPDDAEVTVDIVSVGNTTAGAGLKLWLIGTKV